MVDDHDLFRRGLMALLARDPRFSIVGNAASAEQALQKAQELQPDVILLDNHMPDLDGVDALPLLLTVAPNTHVMMLTISEDGSDMQAALNGGASAYLLKSMKCDDISAAVHRVFLGEIVIAPEMASKLNFNGNVSVAKTCV